LRAEAGLSAIDPAVLSGIAAQEIAALRVALRKGNAGEKELAELPARIADKARKLLAPGPKAVINATGILVHTNLGRAPLGALLDESALTALAGYSTLEFDLASGERGRRDQFFVPHLEALFPGHSALVVNNCAAAMLLALNTFSAGKETVISRGELIEIGESFRVPDIFEKSGAILREVGATNRTRIGDYRKAIGKQTAMLLRVHRSNFEQRGFVESATTAELVALAKKMKLIAGVDLGGGLIDTDFLPLREETIRENLAAGAQFVAFSGDKLLGGPQAGIIVGQPAVIAAMRKNPLYRALRLGKETVLLLNAVLRHYLQGRLPPALAAAGRSHAELQLRCEKLAAAASRNPSLKAGIVAGESRIGGGAAPDAALATPEVALAHSGLSAAKLLQKLREQNPPVIARIVENKVRLNPRTLLDDTEILRLAEILKEI
jgi:L-seryl-tRNA(Ser) seleniumtransferase